jgi:hypothetical protein
MAKAETKDQSIQITMRISRRDLEIVNLAAKAKRISRSGLLRLATFKLIDEEKLIKPHN